MVLLSGQDTSARLPYSIATGQGTVQDQMARANQGGFQGLAAAMAGGGKSPGDAGFSPLAGDPGAGGTSWSPTDQRQAATDKFHEFTARKDAERAAQFQGGGGTGGGGGGGGGGGWSSLGQSQLRWEKERYGMDAATRQRGEAERAKAAGFLPGLVTSYNQAYGEAKAANEKRYQDMLKLVDKDTGQRESDILEAFRGRGSDVMQGLARTGMAHTTVAPTMMTGVTRERESALNRLTDQMQAQRLGIMERKEDRYPDASLMSSLASAIIGQGQGGTAGVSKALSGLRLS